MTPREELTQDLLAILGEEYDQSDMLDYLVVSQSRMEKLVTDLATALADLKTATDADAASKVQLKAQVSDLQDKLAAAQAVDATDQAAVAAANAAVQSAADSVEATAQTLNPLPAVPTAPQEGVPVSTVADTAAHDSAVAAADAAASAPIAPPPVPLVAGSADTTTDGSVPVPVDPNAVPPTPTA